MTIVQRLTGSGRLARTARTEPITSVTIERRVRSAGTTWTARGDRLDTGRAGSSAQPQTNTGNKRVNVLFMGAHPVMGARARVIRSA